MANQDFEDIPSDDDDLPDMDAVASGRSQEKNAEPQPLYRVYEGSRIAIGRAVGPMFQKKRDAALKAYEHPFKVWEECFSYYNADNLTTLSTSRGSFVRGDCMENVIYSNLNVMLPACYSKDPDIACSTTDEQDEEFCKTLQAVINALFKRKDGLNAKSKIKKATGMGLLTNFGVFKLDFTRKDDSREYAISEMTRLTDALAKAKTQEQVDRLYGQFAALERNMEVLRPSGFSLKNILPHNLLVDPYAEQADGLDAEWMMERCFFQTNFLTAAYTKKEEDDEDDTEEGRVLVYKPTHKARFDTGGDRDDGLGIVMDAIDGTNDLPTSHQTDERHAYTSMYFTECWFVWDRVFRRLYLFHGDDWTWPIWVWDDPLKITRFYPYFIMGFSMSTGGTVTSGEVAYMLDQQDEINDIARQRAKIRRTIFDFFYYNSDKVTRAEAEKFIKAVRGDGDEHILGVKAGESKISDMLEAFVPPAAQYEKLFDKQPTLDTINRITNTSDALRGVQFKTNTNVAAVNTYQESMRLSVGSKVDVVEDCVTDLGWAIAEITVQNYDQDDVAGLVGERLSEGWFQMDLPTFRATYSLNLVPGSMEKPNSIFKKKEAIEVCQALGQFASAAPGAVLTIMIRCLESAFTDIVVKPEDWDLLKQEVMATMRKGLSDGEGGDPAAQEDPQAIVEAAKQLPPAVKQRVVQMKQQGASDDEIRQFIVQAVQQKGQANGNPQQPAQRQRGA